MPEPSALPNLALWLDGRQPAYSDGGVTPATAPYGRVAQIAQPAPLSGSWTSSGANRPWREGNALDFHYFSAGHTRGSFLNQPAAGVIAGNNCTVALSWQHRQGGHIAALFSASASVGSLGIYSIGGALTLAHSGGLTAIPGISPGIVAGHRIAQCTLIIVCGSTQYDIYFTVNGTSYTTAVAVTPNSGALTAFVVGANTASSLSSLNTQAAISQFVVCASALSGTNLTNLKAFLLANGPVGFPVDGPLVAMAGDSICEAWLPGTQGDIDATNPTPARYLNAGVAGAHETIPGEIPSYYTTDVLPYYSASRTKNVIVAEGISVNDLTYRFAAGDSISAAAAAVLAGYYAYCDRAKADGWIVIVCTLTPNLAGSNFDAARAIINADIRANWAAHGAFLADLGATVGMATTADAANTTYFIDGTHPTDAGHALLDGTLLPAVTAALAIAPAPPQVSSKELSVQALLDWDSDPNIYLYSLDNS